MQDLTEQDKLQEFGVHRASEADELIAEVQRSMMQFSSKSSRQHFWQVRTHAAATALGSDFVIGQLTSVYRCDYPGDHTKRL
jgi:hypothetical protein